jgi:hypothetical protein
VKEDPPTPAFAKAGAAPGTTGGVELGSFVACHGNNDIPTPQAKFVECGTWLPQLRRQRHQGHINSFLVFYIFNFLLALKRAVCQASNPPNAPNAFLAPPKNV